MEVGSAKAILKWRQCRTSLSAEKPRFIMFFNYSPCSLATQEKWMRDLAEDFGNSGKILGWYRGPRPVIYSTNPDFLKEVFIKESETYIDRPMLDQSDNVPHLIMLKGKQIHERFNAYILG